MKRCFAARFKAAHAHRRTGRALPLRAPGGGRCALAGNNGENHPRGGEHMRSGTALSFSVI